MEDKSLCFMLSLLLAICDFTLDSYDFIPLTHRYVLGLSSDNEIGSKSTNAPN